MTRIYISNFLRRAAEFLSRNRDLIIKWLVIAAAAILAFVLIYIAVENALRSRSQNRIDEFERQFRDADAKAKDAEARADAKQKEIDVRQSEVQFLEARANAAETAMRNTRQKVVTLKETYEEIRNTPVDIAAPVSCADACKFLAELGYPCQ